MPASTVRSRKPPSFSFFLNFLFFPFTFISWRLITLHLVFLRNLNPKLHKQFTQSKLKPRGRINSRTLPVVFGFKVKDMTI